MRRSIALHSRYWLVGLSLLALAVCSAGGDVVCQPDDPGWEVGSIWDGDPPGDLVVQAEESCELEDHQWRWIELLTNVSTPSVTVIRPSGAPSELHVFDTGGMGSVSVVPAPDRPNSQRCSSNGCERRVL